MIAGNKARIPGLKCGLTVATPKIPFALLDGSGAELNDGQTEINKFMTTLALAYKRIYEGFNYRLRTFGSERWADYCRPTSITLSMTERCNARCVHCDIWKNTGPEEILPPEKWKTLLSDLRAWLGPVQVTFSGGEALMRPFTIDLLHHAVGEGLLVEVLTNGYWKNQQRIQRLAETNPWRITVSLDAIGPTHSLIRGRSDFFETTEASLRTLDAVRREQRLQFKIRLKTVVMRQNLGEVDEIARYAASRKGFEVFYQPIEQNYNTEDDHLWFEASDNWPTDTSKAVAVVHKLINLKREGLPIANSFEQLQAMVPYFLDPGGMHVSTQNHSAHESRPICSALTNLEIHPNGDVFSCVRMLPVGNIADQSIREVWTDRPRWWRNGCCLTEQTN